MTSHSLFYCVPQDYTGFDTVGVMPKIYKHDGDFAVSTLLATQFGLALLERAGITGESGKLTTLRSDCLAGAWTASLFLEDRKTSNYHLSPGDLDKAITCTSAGISGRSCVRSMQ